jgi:hypothetical protein
MPNKTLYLFECTSSPFYAVSDDQTGAAIPKLDPTASWLLRREIAPDDLPADVVLTTHTKGFCLLEADDISGPDR